MDLQLQLVSGWIDQWSASPCGSARTSAF